MKKRLLLLILVGIVALGLALRLALTREVATDVDPPAEELQGTRSVDVFFPAASGGLSRETREIVGADHVGDDVRGALEELILGGRAGDRALPSSTRIRNVYFDGEGEITIDFSDHLRLDHPGGSEAEFATLRCLASTLGANFPGIDRVRILVDGESVSTLAGHADISQPLPVKDYR